MDDVYPGDLIESDFINEVKDAATRHFDGGPGTFVDHSGAHFYADCPPPVAVRHFELKNAHTPGGTTTAHPQDWDSDTSEWVTDDDEAREFDVTDPLEKFRGRGKDEYSSPHDEGSKGVAQKNNQSGEWEIVQMQPAALLIRGLATAAGSGTSSFSIDGVDVIEPIGAVITDQDPAANLTVYNSLADGRWGDNAKVEAEWNEDEERWEATYIQPLASHLYGTASAAVAETDATFTLSSPAVLQPDDGTLPSGTITVYNDFSHEIDSGGKVVAIWDTGNNRYLGLQAECPA